MCKRSTEELILNQSVCVFIHRLLFCLASYLQSLLVLILKYRCHLSLCLHRLLRTTV